MSKGHARTWNSFDDEVLTNLHGQGHGVSYIATFMVCAKCTIHRRAKGLGLVFDEKHVWTELEDALLLHHRRLYFSGSYRSAPAIGPRLIARRLC